jgi:hypothetical protein
MHSMSKDGYFGDFESLADEQRAYQEWAEQQQQEPEVVPCFKCGTQMYIESNVPDQNLCKKCKNS